MNSPFHPVFLLITTPPPGFFCSSLVCCDDPSEMEAFLFNTDDPWFFWRAFRFPSAPAGVFVLTVQEQIVIRCPCPPTSFRSDSSASATAGRTWRLLRVTGPSLCCVWVWDRGKWRRWLVKRKTGKNEPLQAGSCPWLTLPETSRLSSFKLWERNLWQIKISVCCYCSRVQLTKTATMTVLLGLIIAFVFRGKISKIVFFSRRNMLQPIVLFIHIAIY